MREEALTAGVCVGWLRSFSPVPSFLAFPFGGSPGWFLRRYHIAQGMKKTALFGRSRDLAFSFWLLPP